MKQKGFVLLPILIIFILLAGVGYLVYQNVGKSNLPAANKTPVVSEKTSTPLVTSTPTTTPNNGMIIYKNEKYNFAFQFPEKRIYGSDMYDTYKVSVDNNKITILDTSHNGSESRDIPFVSYTILDAKSSDKNDLVNWWENSVTDEIGNHKIPTDYVTKLNSVPFDTFIEEFDKTWKLPPSLEITVKDGVEEPGPYHGSIYIYYDFGKPFVLHFEEESTGGPWGPQDQFLILTTISKLH